MAIDEEYVRTVLTVLLPLDRANLGSLFPDVEEDDAQLERQISLAVIAAGSAVIQHLFGSEPAGPERTTFRQQVTSHPSHETKPPIWQTEAVLRGLTGVARALDGVPPDVVADIALAALDVAASLRPRAELATLVEPALQNAIRADLATSSELKDRSSGALPE
ncbi:hypothetical protein [Kineosporia sp. NBRC 101731]|uniref:hypothetical protein n=1 Tax=Kineosporia sp. NBRC 101731 TaxID=3032199 RepID=UPI0024A5E4BF|nr:hypothetical protein [Kineosporia sp. NBRC 101731]GLY29856.1 hypothetical protein Kisp02_32210 [Kineosporia sp. NBRC 101731]